MLLKSYTIYWIFYATLNVFIYSEHMSLGWMMMQHTKQ